ncbi:hypothetical protein [Pelagicoccus mobilis]|uniref:Esterase-like activity of phytase family protein n=1 Tax=Pelagicoccus mobilis TaxID=415221 RepID=A0A934RZZ1_9BACT|nr:hypothetical protein [Pelagicoccus mobilis]MBK1878011.1 hypothetical protein [Pelagicoccus mobilis]
MKELTLALLLVLVAPISELSSKIALEHYDKIKDGDINEPSGLVKSRQFKKVYWTHNDSGDKARIFAITRKGKSVEATEAKKNDDPYKGIKIANASNEDWEDIALDDQGNLLIGDFGNNDNRRRNLTIYVVPEPDPRKTTKAQISQKIEFHYPDQKRFPDPEDWNFDCESLFFAEGKIYLVSKNRSTPFAKLYRLDQQDSGVSNPLTLVSTFDLKGQATAADASPDGSTLAILTYTGVWLFERPEGSDDYFAGKTSFRPFYAKQCEAVCWQDPETLIIANEQRQLFELKIEDIPRFEP